MASLTKRENYLLSLDRCTSHPDFIPAFYRRFMGSSDDVRAKFVHTDFEQQNAKLLNSLKLCASATVGFRPALRDLKERAETHDRHHLKIERRLYDLWLKAAIETAEEFDRCWDDDVEESWQAILGFAIDYMVRRY